MIAPGAAPLLLQDGAALLCVLALIWLAARFGRRFLPGGAAPREPGALQLRASLALDARRRLHLVQTPGGAVLVLTGGGQDVLLPLRGQDVLMPLRGQDVLMPLRGQDVLPPLPAAQTTP